MLLGDSLDGWPTSDRTTQDRVPHLRRGLIATKVGHFRGSENPVTLGPPMPVRIKRYRHRIGLSKNKVRKSEKFLTIK
jgi:hypothetical protein